MTDTKNKKPYLGILIGILVILIIVGVLFGHFRRKGKLSPELEARIKDVHKSEIPTEQIQNNFSKLWFDHVRLTRDVILSYFHNDPEADNIEKQLLQNQTDIAIQINEYYPGSGKLSEELLKEHILIAKDILVDLKKGRLQRIVQDINKWYSNGDEFSEAMIKINPKWDLKDHFKKHLQITEQEVLAEFVGLRKLSENIYNKQIVPQAEEMAQIMTKGL